VNEELRASLEEIRAVIRAGEALERRDVREVLIPLGELLAEERSEEAEAALLHLKEVLGSHGERFEAVVRDELALACAEHVHSVDPRYLDLPNYDLEYTRAARRRLEARLLAAARLGIEPSEGLVAQVQEADRRLVERFGPASGT